MSMLKLAAPVVLALLSGSPAAAQDYAARVARVLKATPLIDGHNDWAEALREREGEGRACPSYGPTTSWARVI